jgi:hypothetical protein
MPGIILGILDELFLFLKAMFRDYYYLINNQKVKDKEFKCK